MAKNKLGDLRNHLFETLEMLKDGDMDLDRAKTIAEVAGVIVDTAKVEVAFIREVGGIGSDFMQAMRDDQRLLSDDNVRSLKKVG